MPSSTTRWVVALLLSSISGPILTTADALPAGPQETNRPRYYFPRHVKRQLGNTPAQASISETTSALIVSSSSSTPALQQSSQSSRDRSSDISSFWESLVQMNPSPSGAVKTDSVSSSPITSNGNGASKTALTTPSVLPSPSPIPSIEPNQSSTHSPSIVESPAASRSTSVVVTSTGGISESFASASPSPASSRSSSATPTTIVDPFIIPGSTDQVPSSKPQSTQSASASSSASGISGPTGVSPTGTPGTDNPSFRLVDGSTVSSNVPRTGISSSLTGESALPTGSSSPSSDLSSNGLSGLLPTGGQPTTAQSSVGESHTSTIVSQATGSVGGIPSSVVLPSSDISFSSKSSLSLPTSGIVVGITTAFGTGVTNTAPTPTNSNTIPTSETGSQSSSISDPASGASFTLEPTGQASTGTTTASGISEPTVGPTAPTPTSAISGITSDVSSLPTLPTATPSGSGVTTAVSDATTTTPVLIPTSETTAPATSGLPSSIPTDILTSSGITPTGSVSVTGIDSSSVASTGVGATTSAVSTELSIATSIPTGAGSQIQTATTNSFLPTAVTSTPIQSSQLTIPVSESTATESSLYTSTATVSTITSATRPAETSYGSTSAVGSSAAITLPPSKTKPPQSFAPISSDTATTLVIPSSIQQEQSTLRTSSQTAMASGVAPWIQPPNGIPPNVPESMFLGQIAFEWGLNYDYVSTNGNSNQIFRYLKQAIAQSLQISEDEVVNYGLRAVDTTQYKGWVTTLAVFMIPKDKNTTLATQVGQPASRFFHAVDENGAPLESVNQLTSLVDPAWPLAYGKLPDGTLGPPTHQANPSEGDTSETTGTSNGGIPGDTTGSRKVNATSAGIATGAVLAAVAYGAAMFLVARRYRKKKAAHRRSSSILSTSRYTYGSVGGGNWMAGARNGRLTPTVPSSRGSRGSSSSNDRSIRTQQISAPVMAENSLGWN